VMRGGEVQQVDTPQRLYDDPANLFVAEFIGSPKMNLIEADLSRTRDGVVAQFGQHRLQIGREKLAACPGIAARVGSRVIIGFRPEDLADASASSDHSPDSVLSIVPELREDMGAEAYVHFGLGVSPVGRTDVIAASLSEDGTLPAPETSIMPFVARVTRTARAHEGEPFQLALNTDRLYLFDTATGSAI
jgi:multiple sugar transport system ATP-binding protein